MCHHSQLSARFCFFLFVCFILFYQCLEAIQPAGPDFPTYLNIQGEIKGYAVLTAKPFRYVFISFSTLT